MSDTAAAAATTTTVSIAEAKAHLARWVNKVETGQPIHITPA